MPTILVIDDNQECADIVAFALSVAGHDVLVANTSRQGAELLKGQAVDLVITDVVMPEKDGLETLMEIRNRYPGLPVIVMSGDSPRFAETYLTAAEKLGAKRTLLKPFSTETLYTAVAQSLNGETG